MFLAAHVLPRQQISLCVPAQLSREEPSSPARRAGCVHQSCYFPYVLRTHYASLCVKKTEPRCRTCSALFTQYLFMVFSFYSMYFRHVQAFITFLTLSFSTICPEIISSPLPDSGFRSLFKTFSSATRTITFVFTS